MNAANPDLGRVTVVGAHFGQVLDFLVGAQPAVVRSLLTQAARRDGLRSRS